MEVLIFVTLMLVVIVVTRNWPSLKKMGRAVSKVAVSIPVVRSISIPDADIMEGTGTIQSCCPTCEYGKGRLDSFIYGAPKKKIVTCETCNTTYRALVF